MEKKNRNPRSMGRFAQGVDFALTYTRESFSVYDVMDRYGVSKGVARYIIDTVEAIVPLSFSGYADHHGKPGTSPTLRRIVL